MSALQELKDRLDPINPSGKTGNCTKCAVEAAEVLATGRNARDADSRDDELGSYSNDSTKQVVSFGAGGERERQFTLWIFSPRARAGVYAVEAGEDHAYNLVKTTANQVYVIDSNLHCYFRVKITERMPKPSFLYMTKPSKLRIYNYADPDDGEGGDMDVYYWGQLSPDWNRTLNNA